MKTMRMAEVLGRVAAIVMGIVFLVMITKLTIDGPDSALTVPTRAAYSQGYADGWKECEEIHRKNQMFLQKTQMLDLD